MKKPLLIFVSLVLAVLTYGRVVSSWAESSVAAASSTVKMYVNPANVGVTSGYTTTLQLRLYKSSSAKVDYAEAHLSFSAAYLEVMSISKQGSYFNNGGGPSVAYNNTNGLITVMGSGPELSQVDDVLMATVVFRAKTAGSGAMSYTSDSQAGDITNGGHVKNVLDTRAGAVVSVSNPVTTSQGSGATSPTTPTPPTTPVSSNPTTNPPATESVSSSNSASTAALSKSDVANTIDRTVTQPPAWLQLLLPAAGGIGLVGIGGLGYVLYRKRQMAGVSLPTEENIGAEVMPTTEGRLGVAVADLSSAVDDAKTPDDAYQSGPVSDDSLASESAETMPDASVSSLGASISSQAPALSVKPTSESSSLPVQPPSIVPETSPSVVDTAQPTEGIPPLDSDPVVPESMAPAPVVQTPTIPLSEPQGQSTPPVSIASIAPTASQDSGGAPPTQEIDYKNLPDMYEIGEQRLQNEGFAPVSQAANKPQSV